VQAYKNKHRKEHPFMDQNIWTPGSIDKAVGKTKEEVGKRLGNAELELKGKVQQIQGDGKHLLSDAKESIMSKANDLVEQFKDQKH
jgi:uncharacterized protein YjbJ (UPF0337 family)